MSQQQPSPGMGDHHQLSPPQQQQHYHHQPMMSPPGAVPQNMHHPRQLYQNPRPTNIMPSVGPPIHPQRLQHHVPYQPGYPQQQVPYHHHQQQQPQPSQHPAPYHHQQQQQPLQPPPMPQQHDMFGNPSPSPNSSRVASPAVTHHHHHIASNSSSLYYNNSVTMSAPNGPAGVANSRQPVMTSQSTTIAPGHQHQSGQFISSVGGQVSVGGRVTAVGPMSSSGTFVTVQPPPANIYTAQPGSVSGTAIASQPSVLGQQQQQSQHQHTTTAATSLQLQHHPASATPTNQPINEAVASQSEVPGVSRAAAGGSINPNTTTGTEIAQKRPHPSTTSAAPLAAEALLDKKRLDDLVREIDPNEMLDEDVKDALLQLTDEFVDKILDDSCRLAKHRNSEKLEAKDVQMILERNWNMWIPGLGTDELRPQKRAAVTDAHKQRMALIRKTLKKPSTL